jgi:hypothetical protein
MTSHCSVVARLTWLDPLPRRQRPIGQRGRTPTARFPGLADSPFARHHGDIGSADGTRRQVHDVDGRLDSASAAGETIRPPRRDLLRWVPALG